MSAQEAEAAIMILTSITEAQRTRGSRVWLDHGMYESDQTGGKGHVFGMRGEMPRGQEESRTGID